jgi:hypothetical protein
MSQTLEDLKEEDRLRDEAEALAAADAITAAAATPKPIRLGQSIIFLGQTVVETYYDTSRLIEKLPGVKQIGEKPKYKKDRDGDYIDEVREHFVVSASDLPKVVEAMKGDQSLEREPWQIRPE